MRLLKDGWLPAYLEWTEDHESPTSFHQWTALAILAIVLERRVWVCHRFFTFYPNLYVVLIAGSALCKKSSSILLGTEILEQIDNAPMALGQKMTPERLLVKLARHKEQLEDLEKGKERHQEIGRAHV